VEQFLLKHASDVIGTPTGFDRLVFRGTLRDLAHHLGMKAYLGAVRVLLRDFAGHAEAMTRDLREASEALARQTGRPPLTLATSNDRRPRVTRLRPRRHFRHTAPAFSAIAVRPWPLANSVVKSFLAR